MIFLAVLMTPLRGYAQNTTSDFPSLEDQSKASDSTCYTHNVHSPCSIVSNVFMGMLLTDWQSLQDQNAELIAERERLKSIDKVDIVKDTPQERWYTRVLVAAGGVIVGIFGAVVYYEVIK